MIDFRYHLVSMVSVFLALAVGIVLGSGPLQGQIGDTLTQQVEALREQKKTLDAELQTAKADAKARDEFERTVNGRVLPGILADRRVALVVLPGTPSALVTSARDSLALAGAEPVSEVTLEKAWVEATGKAARDITLPAVATALGLGTEPGSLDDALAAIISARKPGRASALPSATPSPTGSASAPAGTTPAADLSTDARKAATKLLAEGGLITADRVDGGPADLVLILSGPVRGDDAALRGQWSASYAALAATMDAAGLGTVVAAEESAFVDTVNTTTVVAAIRAGADAAAVSTVDDANTAMGLASMVNALRQQADAGSGQFGREEGATAAFAPFGP